MPETSTFINSLNMLLLNLNNIENRLVLFLVLILILLLGFSGWLIRELWKE